MTGERRAGNAGPERETTCPGSPGSQVRASHPEQLSGDRSACPRAGILENVTLADTQAIAHMLDVSPSTVRWYAHEGRLTRRGRDKRGRTLYAVEEAERLRPRTAA